MQLLSKNTDVYDLFNNPESDYVDPIVEGKWYPKVLSIPIDFENREDEILVQVYVPVMESIMQGGGTKFAVLDIDWDSLRKESGSAEEPTETTESETTDTTEETSTTETTASETETTARKKNSESLRNHKYAETQRQACFTIVRRSASEGVDCCYGYRSGYKNFISR